MATPQKTPIIRRVLEVAGKDLVTPDLLRVTLAGDAVKDFHMVTVGINNKIFIPPPGVEDVHFPDFVNGEWRLAEEHLRPSVRTYTLRALDLDSGTMSIDFALHGEGVASEWALNAKAGDKIGVAMKGVAKRLFPEAEWFMLVADLSAVSVTSVILETLPAGVSGEAIIEVPDERNIHTIKTAADVNVTWLVNPTPGKGGSLIEAVKAVRLPEAGISRFIHAAAEFAVVRELRRYFRQEIGLGRDEFHGFGYWSYGVSEDVSAVERHDESHS